MQKVWELYAISVKIIEKLCTNKCYHLGFDMVEDCNDYIKRRLEKNEFQALKNYDPNHEKKAKAESYLYLLISSRLIDFFNSSKHQRELSLGDSIREVESIEAESNDYNEILERVIGELTYQEQTYIQYCYNDELSHKEIGAIFNITEKQASKKLENIRIKLRRKLKKTNQSLEDIL
jgi:RNA polymerase sigma factor (sigma-70 family)